MGRSRIILNGGMCICFNRVSIFQLFLFHTAPKMTHWRQLFICWIQTTFYFYFSKRFSCISWDVWNFVILLNSVFFGIEGCEVIFIPNKGLQIRHPFCVHHAFPLFLENDIFRHQNFKQFGPWEMFWRLRIVLIKRRMFVCQTIFKSLIFCWWHVVV